MSLHVSAVFGSYQICVGVAGLVYFLWVLFTAVSCSVFGDFLFSGINFPAQVLRVVICIIHIISISIVCFCSLL